MPRPKQTQTEIRLVKYKDKQYESGYRPQWYIRKSEPNQKPQYVSTGTEDEEQAKRLLEEFKEGYYTPQDEDLTVNKICDEYLKYKKQKYDAIQANPKCYQALEWKLKSPREFFGNLHASQITRRLGRDYVSWRRKGNPNISNATIRNDLAILNAALNYTYKEQWIDRLYALELPPAPPPKQRRLDGKEKKDLLSKCVASHLKLFAIIALTTAQRKGAILELKWSQIDMENRLVDFNPPERYITNKRRTALPINDLLYSNLVEALKIAETEYVIEYNGKNVLDIKRSFKAACDKAELKDATPHTLRHTAACDMAAAGVPMQEIAAVLGDSIKTVEKHYLKYSPHHLKNAVNALNI